MNSNLTPARFVRMVGEWMDAGGYVVPVRFSDPYGDWICIVGKGREKTLVANWDGAGRCVVVVIVEQYFPPTEQGLTDALIELACRMEDGK